MSVDDPADRPSREAIEVTVNGERVETRVPPRLKLSDFLRRRGLRGVRVGCEHGVCGACTVLLDGRTAKACLVPAVQADGSEVTTVEGLTDRADGPLHPIQRAFHEEHALQCGFCTSGFVMVTTELLADHENPDEEVVEEYLAHNVCRCTGYRNIYDAVDRAADYLHGPTEAGAEPAADGGSPVHAAGEGAPTPPGGSLVDAGPYPRAEDAASGGSGDGDPSTDADRTGATDAEEADAGETDGEGDR